MYVSGIKKEHNISVYVGCASVSTMRRAEGELRSAGPTDRRGGVGGGALEGPAVTRRSVRMWVVRPRETLRKESSSMRSCILIANLR